MLRETYDYLKSNLTVLKLQELSLAIIDAYKSRDRLKLQLYGDTLFPDEVFEVGENRLFLKLIKHFHPDRLNVIRKEIESAFRESDAERLLFYRKLLSADSEVDRQYVRRFEIDSPEVHVYGHDDIGMHPMDEGDVHDAESGFDFISAVKAAYLGNLDLTIGPEDLMCLEGDLSLPDLGLESLDGVEYCRNITSLNISYNRIRDLSPLRDLTYLEEFLAAGNVIDSLDALGYLSALEIIDLSKNEVEDPAPLLDLEHLGFVDLRENPVQDSDAVRRLEESGVVVLV